MVLPHNIMAVETNWDLSKSYYNMCLNQWRNQPEKIVRKFFFILTENHCYEIFYW